MQFEGKEKKKTEQSKNQQEHNSWNLDEGNDWDEHMKMLKMKKKNLEIVRKLMKKSQRVFTLLSIQRYFFNQLFCFGKTFDDIR